METSNNEFYYKPVVNDRVYEEAMIKASFLVDNGYVKTTDGFTIYNLLERLLTEDGINDLEL